MKLDPAILRALPPSIDAARTTVASHGGSGFSSTAKITTVLRADADDTHGGEEREVCFFMKTASGKDAEVMFAGEHESLNALRGVVPGICPASLAHGPLDTSPKTHFLLTEFLDMKSPSRASTSKSNSSSAPSLAQKLAKLHTTPAPIPAGYDTPQFGFPVPTCCGSTEQDNTYTEDWAEFYGERRLMAILRLSEKVNGKGDGVRPLVERVVKEVVPRLLRKGWLGGEEGIKPVVVHGDLWSGNRGRGILGGAAAGPAEDIIFDPSACYAHSEYELGIMRMFGGFGGAFLKEYHAHCPKTKPVDEYEDRVNLYELYHHLNHYAIFGGGYRGGAVSIMKDLLRKYGEKAT